MHASVFVQSRATLLGVRKANPFAVFVISARLQACVLFKACSACNIGFFWLEQVGNYYYFDQ